MHRLLMIALVVIGLGAALGGAAAPQNGYDLFQKALAAERADGNLQQAIQLYERVVRDSGADRALAARALLRMAECYQKLGDGQARAVYERVIRDFGDQAAAVTEARARLRASSQNIVSARGDRVVWGPAREVDLFGTISPDGRFLTYVDWFGAINILVRDLQAGTDRPLTPNTFAGQHGWASWSAISRTGEQVAYSWAPGDTSGDELWIARLQSTSGAAPRRLLAATGHDRLRPFDWSPDGNSIALLVEREDRSSQIAVVDVRAGSLHILKSVDWRGVGKMVFSPDGRHVAYDLLEGEGPRRQRVLVIAADASRETAIVDHASQNHVMGWAASGQLLFASDRSGSLSLWTVQVERGRANGAPMLVKSDIGSSTSLGLTRNGTLYLWKRAGATYVGTTTIDFERGELTSPTAGDIQRFIESRGRPAWSADGKQLLFVSCGPTGGGPCELTLRAVDSGEERKVPHELRYMGFPRLSRDSRTILTDGTDLKGRRGIYLIDVQTGTTTLVAIDEPSYRRRWPDWSPDGRSIYYQHDGGRDAATVVLERGQDTEREVLRAGSCNRGRVSFSPDGQRIACVSWDRTTDTLRLIVLPVGGGEPQELLRGIGGDLFPWQWMPDGSAMLVRKNLPSGQSELWHTPLRGEARRLNADLRRWVEPFQLHPDGRRIAFVASAGEAGAEVWALENVLPQSSGTR